MSAIDVMVPEPLVRAVGWALLHFVWQGTLVSLAAAVVLRLLRQSASDVRYVVAAIALALMATLPIVTAVQALDGEPAFTISGQGRPSSTAPVSAGPGARDDALTPIPVRSEASAAPGSATLQAFAARAGAIVEGRLPLFVTLWMAGVALLAVRLLGGWLCVQRLATRGTTPGGEALQAVMQRLRRRLHIGRHVRLLLSSRVDVPTVIGWVKPTILLPVSALAGLSPAQIEAILAHELAHIRRHDYLVNLLQTSLETLLFYHPGVWWLSKQIRIERENCCDDLAVSLCGDRVLYARTLADLEELREPGGRLVLAATGGTLLARVRRLLAAPASHAGRGPAWLAAATAVMLMVAVGTGLNRHSLVAMEAAAPIVVQRSGDPLVDLLIRAIHSVRDVAFWWQSPMPPPPGPPPPADPAPLPPPPPPPPPPAPPADRAGDVPAPESPAQPAMPAPAPAAPATPLPPGPERMQAPAPPAPSLPAPPSVPASPSLPAPPSVSQQGSTQDSTGNFTWVHNDERLEIKYRGTFELSDDDADIVSMSPNGHLRISDGGWLRGRSVEFTSDASGQITRRFFVGSSERPFEPEGRAWLAQTLPRFIRSSGFAAKSRVARFLKSGGVSAVLAEISLIETSYGKKTYFVELMRTATFDPPAARRLLEQAGREVTSNYELASVLVAASEKLLVDEASQKAYFDAASRIGSDYEKRRAFTAALKRMTVPPSLLPTVLGAIGSMKSDYERATLLLAVSDKLLANEPAQKLYFDAARGIRSDYEKRRAYSAGLKGATVSPELLAGILDGVRSIGSDYEAATLLLQIVQQQPIEAAARAPFFAALETIGSGYEKGRVLRALLRRDDVSTETLLAVLQAAGSMSGSHEAYQVLQAVVRSHELSSAARDAYVKAAERLPSHEQNQALAALVRAERR